MTSGVRVPAGAPLFIIQKLHKLLDFSYFAHVLLKNVTCASVVCQNHCQNGHTQNNPVKSICFDFGNKVFLTILAVVLAQTMWSKLHDRCLRQLPHPALF